MATPPVDSIFCDGRTLTEAIAPDAVDQVDAVVRPAKTGADDRFSVDLIHRGRVEMEKKLAILMAFLLLGISSVAEAQTTAMEAAARQPVCSQPALPSGFRYANATVNGATLHYIIGGSGPAVALIHGFPEDSSAWIGLLSTLGQHFTVVAPDMRGIGGSTAPADAKYDGLTLASDIKALLGKLGLTNPYVVGHDMGGIVSYVLARTSPEFVRGAMLVENPLPGIGPWDEIAAAPTTWHIHFHQTPKTPELLISGREEDYFREQFFEGGAGRSSSVSRAALSHYACAYSGPSRLAAGLGQYRSVSAVAKLNTADHSPIAVPLNLVGGSASFGSQMPGMAENLRAIGWSTVTVDQIPGAAHYLVDEKPTELANLIIRYASRPNKP